MEKLTGNEGLIECVTAQPTLAELVESGKCPSAMRALIEGLVGENGPLKNGVLLVLLGLKPAEIKPAQVALRRAFANRRVTPDWKPGVLLVRLNDQVDVLRKALLEDLHSNVVPLQTAAARVLEEMDLPGDLSAELLTLAVQRNNAEFLRLYYRAAPDAIGPLAALLDHPDQAVRTLASETLGSFGPAAVPAVIRALERPAARQAATETLGKIGFSAAAAVPALTRLVPDPDLQVALSATVALSRIEKAPREAIAVLLRALKSGGADQRLRAVETLGLLGVLAEPALPRLCQALSDPAESVRTGAATALGQLGKLARESIPELVSRATGDEEPGVRQAAILALFLIARAEPEVHEAVARGLLPCLSDRDKSVPRYALMVLYRLARNKTAPIVLPHLVAELRDPNSSLLGKVDLYIHESGPAAVPHLAGLLRDPNPEVRGQAAIMLGRLYGDGTAKLTAPLLLKALDDPENSVRSYAQQALGNLGEQATPILPALIERVQCQRGEAAMQAAMVLGQIGKPARSALPALLPLFKSDIPDLRLTALQAVRRIEPKAAELMPLYTALLADEDTAIRGQALEALAGWGQPAVPVLLRALTHEDVELRQWASRYLVQLKPAPQDATILAAALKDENAEVRANAARVLGKLGRAADAAVPTLIALLKDVEPEVRLGAAEALGELGEPARAAGPALKALRRDRQEGVRRAAALALGKVEEERGASR